MSANSTGGGEVTRYLARHGESRVSKAAIISAVPPLMLKTPANPLGLPKEVFDDFQAQLAANRSEFYRAIGSGSFYNYNKPGAKASEAIVENWWRQGMMGGAKAHCDGIVALSQTDFTEDLKKINVPVLVIRSERRSDRGLCRRRSKVRWVAQERNFHQLQGHSRTECRPRKRPRSMPTCWRSSRRLRRSRLEPFPAFADARAGCTWSGTVSSEPDGEAGKRRPAEPGIKRI